MLSLSISGFAVSAVAEPNDDKTVTININNTNVVIARDIINLYNDDVVRTRIEGMLRPLLKEGIEEFQVRQGPGAEPKIVEKVTKREAVEAYENRREEEREPTEPPVLDSTYEAALEIVKVPFRENLVWNFALGKAKLSAEMKDQAFLERHRAALTSFSTGDVLIVKLRTRSWPSPTGLKVIHEIVEVSRHIHRAPEQQELELKRQA